jgi:hypothetical protein
MSGAVDRPRLTHHRDDSIIKSRLDGPRASKRATDSLAFGLLCLLTLLLYVSPNDLIPAMGTFPWTGAVAVIAPLAYAHAQFKLDRPVIAWTIEVKMVFAMLFLAIIFTPIAASRTHSVNTLNGVFIKAVIIIILITGLVRTRARLRSIISLSVICGTGLAALVVRVYANGGQTSGAVGIFSNPDELAMALNLLIPLAVTMARIASGAARQFYIVCALTMAAGSITTFSRPGLITLATSSAVMVWKFGNGKRGKFSLAGLMAPIVLIAALSGVYHTSLRSAFERKSIEFGSARQRSETLKRGLDLALRHSMIGLGMGNFQIREKDAHNAYLETAAELSAVGLLAYLILILASLRGLSPIEWEARTISARRDVESRALSAGLQAVLIAYIVNSFFISSQYLWYLYYAAGLAVAWRLIYTAERSYVTAEKYCRLDSQRSY